MRSSCPLLASRKKGSGGAGKPAPPSRSAVETGSALFYCAKMRFEWDRRKARGNLGKHGIGFEDAARALSDPDRLDEIDERFEYGEERIRALCRLNLRVLCVVYTRRGNVYRIVMARRATTNEEAIYFGSRDLHLGDSTT